MFIYVIKPNDNLGKISKIYSTTINEICNTNGIKENEFVFGTITERQVHKLKSKAITNIQKSFD